MENKTIIICVTAIIITAIAGLCYCLNINNSADNTILSNNSTNVTNNTTSLEDNSSEVETESEASSSNHIYENLYDDDHTNDGDDDGDGIIEEDESGYSQAMEEMYHTANTEGVGGGHGSRI